MLYLHCMLISLSMTSVEISCDCPFQSKLKVEHDRKSFKSMHLNEVIGCYCFVLCQILYLNRVLRNDKSWNKDIYTYKRIATHDILMATVTLWGRNMLFSSVINFHFCVRLSLSYAGTPLSSRSTFYRTNQGFQIWGRQ